jgi:D-alanyl-D-alanine dipeptidase
MMSGRRTSSAEGNETTVSIRELHSPQRQGREFLSYFLLRALSRIAVVFAFPFGLCVFLAAQTSSLQPGLKPLDVPAKWKAWIGEYGVGPENQNTGSAYVLSERDGFLLLVQRERKGDDAEYKAIERFPETTAPDHTEGFQFHLNSAGVRVLTVGATENSKLSPDVNATTQVLIKPVTPIDDLRRDALADTPPPEAGHFRKPDLVELAPLDPAIHLEIRYATTNDFLGAAVYTQARAFMQRPAADALVRALHKLQPLGYGLLIHDAYRPWYVTKIFWDATPPEGKIFVADPEQGSRHNRGCAVDLTLYDVASGKPIEMPGTYDEMSPRSFPDYPGGTSLQRWHRDLLRRAMESEGFSVYEHEWWHFDYKDWHEYPILNIKFEDLQSGQGLATSK